MDLVPYIFHEQQEGNLCAQHCLNALLQGPYFTAIELADLARQLDQRERDALEGWTPSGGARAGSQSQNMDDSGFFSVQVISEALAIWQLQIIPWGSQDVKDAKQHPEFEQAFILNLHEHWFTLRRFGPSTKRWYDLNSMHPAARPMSDTYLGMTLSQLEAEQYSVFVVRPLQGGALASPEVIHVSSSSSSKSRSEAGSVSTLGSSAPAPTTTSAAAAAEQSNTSPANSFLAERREMERIRRQRLEALERQKSGNTSTTSNNNDHASSSLSSSTNTTGRSQQHATTTPAPKTVAVIKTPSCLPACEADRVAATLPYDQFESEKPKGPQAAAAKKEEPFSGAGYRLGNAAAAAAQRDEDEDAMLAAALASSVEEQYAGAGSGGGSGSRGDGGGGGGMDDGEDTEWEMMQQAIAMSLQKKD
ncbi:Ataxin-3 [Actinomortierella ambigua]|uniref:Ataxin-3 homolog n=1 Tax=Actinomortierella ambigua TaxID=1343610 RepID=A0A9P6QFB9_9FUNG|nr:Ataxin-3 [Actinomortierella ambigua]